MRRLFLLSLAVAAPAVAQPSDRRVVIVNEGWRLVGNLTLPAARPRAPAVLLLNGAGRDRTDYTDFAARLAVLGIASLRLDLRATGESINRGRFIPFDSTGHNEALGFDRAWSDVRVALRWLAAEPGIDPKRIGAVGASFSGEALAVALRQPGGAVAVAVLSPGSFSDSSLARVDRDARRWLFVYSSREMIVRRWQMDQWTRRGSTRARVEVVADSGHATRLLVGSPMLAERLAEWFATALPVERIDDRWARAADRVAAGLAAGWDDLRRPGAATAPLGEGGAGRVRFLAAWHGARGTAGSGAALRRAADQLLALGRGPDSINTSLYFGRAGVALALLDAADALADPSLRQAARSEIVRVIESVGRPPDQRGATANDVLMGDAGTAATLRAVWRRLDDTSARETAFALARSLATRGRPDSGDLYWPWRDNAPWNLPNFSHGTAGVATVLSMIAREPAAPPGLRDASLGGARYLRRIAVVDRRGMRIPNGWPVPERGWARPYDASWAHGQAGTARIFWELWQATRDTSHLAVVQSLVAGLDSAGLMTTPADGYGAEPFGFDYRFGLTGIADLFADLYDATGDRRYLARALALAERILATADPGPALTWTRPRPVFMPDPGTAATFTGLLHGAAGPGLLFLKLDALLHGRRPPEPLPDSPFGW